jgi:hypothetical protein
VCVGGTSRGGDLLLFLLLFSSEILASVAASSGMVSGSARLHNVIKTILSGGGSC